MTPLKILFLNGPPGAGKDTIGRMIRELNQNALIWKFANALKVRTHALYGIIDDEGVPATSNSYEHCKDTPLDEFLGLTPRQAYIAVSEVYFKPTHGQDIFGKLLAHLLEVLDLQRRFFVITDSGFKVEAGPIIEEFGADRCVLWRIHRPGHNFWDVKDSRSYWRMEGLRSADIHNDGDLDHLLEVVAGSLLHLDLPRAHST